MSEFDTAAYEMLKLPYYYGSTATIVTGDKGLLWVSGNGDVMYDLGAGVAGSIPNAADHDPQIQHTAQQLLDHIAALVVLISKRH